MLSMRLRAVVFGLIILVGLASAMPNLLSETTTQHLPNWFGENKVALGLDLSGGSHLLLEVDTKELLQEKNQQLAKDIGRILRDQRLFHQSPEVANELITIRVTDPKDMDALEQAVRNQIGMQAMNSGFYRLKDSNNTLTIEATAKYQQQLQRDAVERSLDVVRRRLNESGLVEPNISKQGDDGILIQLPGVDNPQHIRKLLGTTAKMTFHWVTDGYGGSTLRITDAQGHPYALEANVALEGKHVSDAQLAFHPQTNEPVVSFTLDRTGASIFGEMTKQNVGRALAVVLDNSVITAPVIREMIGGGQGEISGNFTVAEASDLALLLRAGALPAPLHVIEERTVGPELGSDSIQMGITTGLIGIALVFAFMIAIYGRWGLIASTSLAIFIGLVFGVLSAFGATLTLPGIAGLILSIGMAVDANILINERIREETRSGKSAQLALQNGFDRAFATILDSNVTSLLAISLLFLFGSGPVRGFAVAMAVGLVVSMFTAISVTRLLMEWTVRNNRRKPLNISGLISFGDYHSRTINFMRGRFVGLSISVVLSVAAVFLFIFIGLDYGIDFSGGTVMEVFAPNTSVEALREALRIKDIGDIAIQEFGSAQNFLLRLPLTDELSIASAQHVEQVKAAILAIAPDANFLRTELVGGKVSGDFADKTIIAILLAAVSMLGYLWLRFESHFAMAAILTIALDLTKTIGFFILAGVEFNLTAVAALLALIGYSVNDKVVVFDRIRENLRLAPDKPLMQLFDESISSTLTRTVYTSATTLLAITPMVIAGGHAVASFALPMFFGIIIGTSSSIFIAAPIVLLLGQRRERRGLAQLKLTAEEQQRQLDLIP